MRCNYCRKAATTAFRYRSRCYPSGRMITITCAACDEHVGCVNWESMLKIQSERTGILEPPYKIGPAYRRTPQRRSA